MFLGCICLEGRWALYREILMTLKAKIKRDFVLDGMMWWQKYEGERPKVK